ncbi:MAG TPA: isoprenylcysteine carboxylmethyltransferase family protein [Candidatus Sulfotelmatobacter sp.]|nr:isoprenylcysteine carboxylmethyltransferase family protein [Candidatus Sulfotelmatobacter sp.]
MAKRLAVFVYGLLSYMAFFLTFVYAVGFIGNLYVPRSMDSTAQMSFWPALLIDSLLLLAFAVQHSVMARPAFKEVLTRFIPVAAERSTYVLCSSLLLVLLFAFWQPMGGVVWNLTNPVVRSAINVAFGLGFALVFVATLLINHFDLFGLRQVALYLARRPYTYLEFRTPLFYRYVRHPLYVGWLVAFWATPTMTGAHLLFAVLTSAYILTAIRWEERDLIVVHGSKYQDYQKRVPRLIPSLARYPVADDQILNVPSSAA